MHSCNGSSMKRKRGERVFRFESFCEPGVPCHFHGCFYENIMALVEFGNAEPGTTNKATKCWSFRLELHHHPPIFVRLFIVEEIIALSPYHHCPYCRTIGWGHHMICNKRFHIVLSSKGKGSAIPMIEELELEAIFRGTDSANKLSKSKEPQGHLMHGIMHANGFGHLIFVKGIEAGSEHLSGNQILFLWDRICNALHLRKVSLIDVAMKETMELRLIHGITYGHSWFGHWGYKFGHGSYGITEQMYQKSIEALQALPLCLLLPHFSCSCHELPIIIAKYQAICGHALLTLGDLFRFMIELKNHLPMNSTATTMEYHGIISEATCRWSMKRVEMAAQVIVSELKKTESRWTSRQQIRDAARAYIGDTGLLDYVLKSLGNHVVGNYIVRRVVNPVTKVLEYCLEDISNKALPTCNNKKAVRFRCHVTRAQLSKDLLYLYKHVLKERRPGFTSGIFSSIPMAVRIILDMKNLVKDYGEESQLPGKIESGTNGTIELMCTVNIIGEGKLPPYEQVSMEAHITIGELKRVVEKHYREMYLGLKNFIAEKVENKEVKDSDLVLGVVEPGSRIVIQGRVAVENGVQEIEIYESGNEERVINCRCGAKEDDGERMISCDICDVFQHTRCMGIADAEEIPRVFLCSQCEHDIVSFPSIHY
ncbi:PHD Zn-finger proteins protein [Dioscorea alata]|uniref:PHD Zn-finger proteins protein n=1 Tax=Dioscorea alata TaxID=55571 RepID=A0ACB7U727_DIOAL|nr:PHD Zn-finger proteins protein [Dioscorea alata]